MSQDRIFFPVHSIYVSNYTKGGSSIGQPISAPRGVQSCAIETSFNLEQVFELGQLDIYENIEALPSVTVSTTKVLDGTKPIYFMATKGSVDDLNGKNALTQCDIWLNIYAQDQTASSGTPLQTVMCSGMYLNDITYNFPVDGNFTEELSFTGNDKFWNAKAVANGNTSAPSGNYSLYQPTGDFDNTDQADVIGAGVQRREDLRTEQCTFPTIIPGMAEVNAATTRVAAQLAFQEHVQSISVSTSLGREDIYQLGARSPYYKSISFPLTVTCTFECISGEGDQVSADSLYNNLTNETIKLIVNEGLVLDLGDSNKLSRVSYNGGDATGGNVTTSYEFNNFNFLSIYTCDANGSKDTLASHYPAITDDGSRPA